jgi:menaquinone-dependent protoporphyrinogen oxidase
MRVKRGEGENPMKVLVSSASKHGATSEIADEIGKVLRDALHERSVGDDVVVDVRSAERVSSVEDYDAVVLGSAVYAGHWLEPERELVERHAGALTARPVWLFSSGPGGEPPKPAEEESVDVSGIFEATGARDHRMFPGRLDKSTLGFAEKAIVLALRVAEGDFRDWDAIRRWARDIATELRPEASSGRSDSYG